MFHSTLHTKQSSTQNNKYQLSHEHSCSPDDGYKVARNVQRLINILRINCAPSWLNLQDYTGLHGQQNTQKHVIDYGPFNWLSFIAHSTGTFVQFRNTSYLQAQNEYSISCKSVSRKTFHFLPCPIVTSNISDKESDTGSGFSLSTSVSPCHYQSTNGPFIYHRHYAVLACENVRRSLAAQARV